MEKETAHKLLELVLNSNHDGVNISFAPPCGKGFACAISIHDWQEDEITDSRIYTLLNDVWYGAGNETCTTEEIIGILEGLQDAEH